MDTELISFEESVNAEENSLRWDVTNGLEPLLTQVKKCNIDLYWEKIKCKIFRVRNIKKGRKEKDIFKLSPHSWSQIFQT